MLEEFEAAIDKAHSKGVGGEDGDEGDGDGAKDDADNGAGTSQGTFCIVTDMMKG